MWWLWLLACSGTPEQAVEHAQEATPPAEVASTKPAPAAAAPEGTEVRMLFVHASLLRLRPEPRSDTATSSPLAINTPLRHTGSESDWYAVTAADGRQGWVHRDFVGPDILSLELAKQRATEATDNKVALSWRQRAAALAPRDVAVLEELAVAYEAVGENDTAAQVRKVANEQHDLWDGTFAKHAEADALTRALAEVDSAEALARHWRAAYRLSEEMAEPLNQAIDLDKAMQGTDPMDGLIQEKMPWAELTFYAEGTYAALELKSEFWADAAKRTPEPWDDQFVALMDAAYDNASGRGWGAWQQREWDYGGCSPFGNGEELHLKLLVQTDTLHAIQELRDPVHRIRREVLSDIEKPQGSGEFPYCKHMGSPTPVEALKSEAEQILAQVKLSDAERAMIGARIASGFAEAEPTE